MKTIKGLLIAESWDDHGVPVAFKICSSIEKDYHITDPSMHLDCIKLVGKSVKVLGEVTKFRGTNRLVIHEIHEDEI